MSVNRFYSLDLFRGFAALSVALGHFVIDGVIAPGGVLPQAHELSVIWNFSFIYAVDFFLVLSGFILAHSYLNDMQIPFRDFALRRFLRMYPLHLLTLLVTLAIFALFGLHTNAKEVLLHFFFIQNMGFGPTGVKLNVPAWTISVEFWINIAAFLVLLVIRPKNIVVQVALFLLACACFALIARLTGNINVNQQNYMGFLNAGLVRCSASFILGYLSYRLYLRCHGWRPATWLISAVWLVFFAIILALPGHSPLGFATPFLFAGIILVLACSEPRTQALTRPYVLLGDVSFSVYLVHDPLLRLFRETGFEKSALTGICFMAVVLVVAALSYRLYERPVYKWGLGRTASLRKAAA